MIMEARMLEFIRATAEDLDDYMKAKIDAFSDDLHMYDLVRQVTMTMIKNSKILNNILHIKLCWMGKLLAD